MNQKKYQEQCLTTSKDSNPVLTKREKDKRTYQTNDKHGGVIKLIIKIPPSKLAQTIRSMLFRKAKRK